MANDPFQDLLELEDGFYKEGYDAGISDSAYAGMIEGKVFGIEKGYEKALELAKMHGRALVWKARLSKDPSLAQSSPEQKNQMAGDQAQFHLSPLEDMSCLLNALPSNSRLQKHVDSLLASTDGATILTDNSDEAVTEFDDRLGKSKAKIKIIANIASEPISPTATSNAGIEDATGLNARQ